MRASDICPCGLGGTYGECCGRWHRGEDAPTAELLMRSRYTAFVVADAAYLRRTWHPSTRPAELDLSGGPEFTGLEILDGVGGSLFELAGTVRFRAHYREGGAPGVMEEHSRFVREDGRWFYLDAI
ncbi:UPF0225 protein [Actinorhabdospora filicis]|uniref:UPF0225 protein Afil01_44420 n=1 Tax=Actinorhabdospora filicis TaxID=1785913 RepID=A0A9W6SPH9_9ACTN|nr:YchJ family protein [Actinorhabdospora filicis]GLZ79635.1 UPF0225 protein [Actinorhabdospora filicis]